MHGPTTAAEVEKYDQLTVLHHIISFLFDLS
jgi:hypothetical protein